MLNTLFMAASQSLLFFGDNALGGKPGFMATLHTWDQKLNAHFHLHSLVAGGTISKDGSCWIPRNVLCEVLSFSKIINRPLFVCKPFMCWDV